MKLAIKKFIYLLNDATSLLLKKDIEHSAETARRLRLALIVVSIILLLSLALNLYFYQR